MAHFSWNSWRAPNCIGPSAEIVLDAVKQILSAEKTTSIEKLGSKDSINKR
jgi:hypothetical protein